MLLFIVALYLYVLARSECSYKPAILDAETVAEVCDRDGFQDWDLIFPFLTDIVVGTGSNSEVFTVLMDTGSSHLFLMVDGCRCLRNNKTVTCSSRKEYTISNPTDGTVSFAYGEGGLQGEVTFDSVGIDNFQHPYSHFVFTAANKVTYPLSSSFAGSGILGLAPKNYIADRDNLPVTLNNIDKNSPGQEKTFYFEQSCSGGRMLQLGIPPQKSIAWMPVPQKQSDVTPWRSPDYINGTYTHWQVEMHSVKFGSNHIKFEPAVAPEGKGNPNGNKAVFDTGAGMICLPGDSYKDLKAKMTNFGVIERTNKTNKELVEAILEIPCDKVSLLPDLTFTFMDMNHKPTNGYIMTHEDYMIPYQTTRQHSLGLCQLSICSCENIPTSPWLLGVPFQKKFNIVFHFGSVYLDDGHTDAPKIGIANRLQQDMRNSCPDESM